MWGSRPGVTIARQPAMIWAALAAVPGAGRSVMQNTEQFAQTIAQSLLGAEADHPARPLICDARHPQKLLHRPAQ